MDPTPAPPARPAGRPDRTLLVIVGVIVALVVIALVVVFTRGEPPTLDESTPEGVVQRYSAAVIEGDEEAAMEYLSDRVAEDCTRVPVSTAEGVRVTLVDTREREDSADVRVLIATTYGGGPLGPDEYQEEAVFDLVREGGGWRIDSAPWQLTVCQEVR